MVYKSLLKFSYPTELDKRFTNLPKAYRVFGDHSKPVIYNQTDGKFIISIYRFNENIDSEDEYFITPDIEKHQQIYLNGIENSENVKDRFKLFKSLSVLRTFLSEFSFGSAVGQIYFLQPVLNSKNAKTDVYIRLKYAWHKSKDGVLTYRKNLIYHALDAEDILAGEKQWHEVDPTDEIRTS